MTLIYTSFSNVDILIGTGVTLVGTREPLQKSRRSFSTFLQMRE
jgi:hypothetical protein